MKKTKIIAFKNFKNTVTSGQKVQQGKGTRKNIINNININSKSNNNEKEQ